MRFNPDGLSGDALDRKAAAVNRRLYRVDHRARPSLSNP
jgi:hypothetical protein